MSGAAAISFSRELWEATKREQCLIAEIRYNYYYNSSFGLKINIGQVNHCIVHMTEVGTRKFSPSKHLKKKKKNKLLEQ